MIRKKYVRMYKSRWHILVTFLVIAAPIVYFIGLNQITGDATVKLSSALTYSVARVVAAFCISAFFGWLFAVLFYHGRRSHIALPLFDVLQSVPSLALLPIAVSLFGASEPTIIFFLMFAMIWPIFFSVISSLKLIKHDWEEAAAIMQLSGFQYLRLFLWPVSLSGLITGSIIGLGEGWEALIATEIIIQTKNGLGPFFNYYSADSTITILGVCGLLLLIFSINKIVWLPLLEWSHRSLEE